MPYRRSWLNRTSASTVRPAGAPADGAVRAGCRAGERPRGCRCRPAAADAKRTRGWPGRCGTTGPGCRTRGHHVGPAGHGRRRQGPHSAGLPQFTRSPLCAVSRMPAIPARPRVTRKTGKSCASIRRTLGGGSADPGTDSRQAATCARVTRRWTRPYQDGSRAIAAASDHDAARLVFQSAIVLIDADYGRPPNCVQFGQLIPDRPVRCTVGNHPASRRDQKSLDGPLPMDAAHPPLRARPCVPCHFAATSTPRGGQGSAL